MSHTKINQIQTVNGIMNFCMVHIGMAYTPMPFRKVQNASISHYQIIFLASALPSRAFRLAFICPVVYINVRKTYTHTLVQFITHTLRPHKPSYLLTCIHAHTHMIKNKSLKICLKYDVNI